MKGFPACIVYDRDDNGAGGGESYKAYYRVGGTRFLLFPSAFVISSLQTYLWSCSEEKDKEKKALQSH